MNTTSRTLCSGGIILALALAAGCADDPVKTEKDTKDAKPEAKKVLIGPNVFFEKAGDTRRVLVSSAVCLREGPLELFLTRKGKKEHEAVLTADVDARDIHKALLAAGAEAGTPVRYQPKYTPASGQKIKVTLQWEEKGKLKSADAREWVRNSKSKKPLTADWLFVGSRLIPNPLDPKGPDYYLANDGDLICVSNFETALLDLNINSSKENSELNFEANTEKIPEKETKVVVVLEPVPEKKK